MTGPMGVTGLARAIMDAAVGQYMCMGVASLDDMEIHGSFSPRHLAETIIGAMTVRTPGQLADLPFLSIVREVLGPPPGAGGRVGGVDYGGVWERRTSGWECVAGGVDPWRTEPRLPARLLYSPEKTE
jgi:hypothetical protein